MEPPAGEGFSDVLPFYLVSVLVKMHYAAGAVVMEREVWMVFAYELQALILGVAHPELYGFMELQGQSDTFLVDILDVNRYSAAQDATFLVCEFVN